MSEELTFAEAMALDPSEVEIYAPRHGEMGVVAHHGNCKQWQRCANVSSASFRPELTAALLPSGRACRRWRSRVMHLLATSRKSSAPSASTFAWRERRATARRRRGLSSASSWRVRNAMTTPVPPLVPEGPPKPRLVFDNREAMAYLIFRRFDVSRDNALAAIDELAENFPAIRKLAAKR